MEDCNHPDPDLCKYLKKHIFDKDYDAWMENDTQKIKKFLEENREAKELKLHFGLCPGDTVVGTAAIECLHRQHPNQYLTEVSGTATDAIFENNPHIVKNLKNPESIKMEYPLINRSSQTPVHFMQGYVDFLSKKLKIKLDLCVNRPYLYLSNQEKKWINQVQEHFQYKGKFWLICSGIKTDYTVKGWGFNNYQKVIDRLSGIIQFVQIGEKHHNHPPLKGVINLVGKTDTRQLIRLCYHAQGGLGGVSLLHHIMAALEKPMVTIASGMESVAWERYSTGIYLHKGSCLPCGNPACWKSRIVKLNDGDNKDNDLCPLPVTVGDDIIPKCMALIGVDEVVNSIKAYYNGGLLSH